MNETALEVKNPNTDEEKARKCVCRSVKGIACPDDALDGSEYCFIHHPFNLVNAEELRTRASRGDVVTEEELSDRYRAPRLVDPEDMQQVIDRVAKENMQSENSPGRNRVMLKLVDTTILVHKWREQVEFGRRCADQLL